MRLYVACLVGAVVGWVVGLGACYVYWVAIGSPTAADWTSWVGGLIWGAGPVVGCLVGALIGAKLDKRKGGES